jgi:hypothetical protein
VFDFDLKNEFVYFCRMEKPTYNVKVSDDGFSYFFDSISESQTIKKAVKYLPTNGNSELYQLVFGNVLPNDEIDIFAVSNNDDMPLVITTIVGTLVKFFEQYPNKKVYFTGSTTARTRLYRASISKFLKITELYYQVFGIFADGSIEIFNPTHQYSAFLITQKDDKYS